MATSYTEAVKTAKLKAQTAQNTAQETDAVSGTQNPQPSAAQGAAGYAAPAERSYTAALQAQNAAIGNAGANVQGAPAQETATIINANGEKQTANVAGQPPMSYTEALGAANMQQGAANMQQAAGYSGGIGMLPAAVDKDTVSIPRQPGSSPQMKNPGAALTTAGTVQDPTGTGNDAAVPAAGEPEENAAQDAQMSYWEKQKKFYEDMYNTQVANNNQAAADAAARAAEMAQQNIDQLNRQWQNTNKQLYRDYMENQRKTPQQLAAMGYNGGLSETSLLRLANAYQEALNENEAARSGDITKINTQLQQNDWEAQQAANQANQNAYMTYAQSLNGLEQQQYQEQQTKAETMAATGDFSGYLNLGYSQDEVDYMTRLWLKQNPKLWNTWVKAHPDEAERMGIKLKKKKSGGGYAGSGDPNDEKPKTPTGDGKTPVTGARDATPKVAVNGSGYVNVNNPTRGYV